MVNCHTDTYRYCTQSHWVQNLISIFIWVQQPNGTESVNKLSHRGQFLALPLDQTVRMLVGKTTASFKVLVDMMASPIQMLADLSSARSLCSYLQACLFAQEFDDKCNLLHTRSHSCAAESDSQRAGGSASGQPLSIGSSG